VIVFSSTIGPDGVNRPAGTADTTGGLDAEGLAFAGLIGAAFAADADRLAVGLVVLDGELVDAAAEAAAAGAAVGAAAEAVGTAVEAAAEVAALVVAADGAGAALDALGIAVQAVPSRAGASSAQASIRRMGAIFADPTVGCRYCQLRPIPVGARPRFDPPDSWSVLLGVGALRASPLPRVLSLS
jgi:hypothetical protein